MTGLPLGSPAVRTGAFVSRAGGVVNGLRSTSRRVWWTSFVLATSLSALWALANPVFASPDEPANVVRAEALAHGELTGREPRGRLDGQFRRVRDSARIVRAPEVYRRVSGPPCFADEKSIAACFGFQGSSRDTDVVTYAAEQPPAYHAVVGIASWVRGPGAGTVYVMRFLTALMTGAFLATAITALRRATAPLLLAAGLLLAVTPMVLFMSSAVNPNGVEIGAAIALWVCGIVLVSDARTHVDNRLVTAVGIAGCALALSRQLGPLWLGLIALAIVGVSSRGRLARLARSGWARVWLVAVGACVVGQVAWDAVVRPRDATLADRAPAGLSSLEAIEDAIGSTFDWYREMIGWFGWVDTPAPVLTWLLWTSALAFFVFVAIAWARRRDVAVVLAVLAGSVVVPVVIAATPYRAAGTAWQGRYTLPLAVGVPILAAFALASTERGRELVTRRFLFTVGVVVGVAQFLAFAQNLRRYTVGYDGELQYWKAPEWLPPLLSPLLYTLVYAAAIIAFTAWLLWIEPTRRAARV
jgi:hypothetical protein